MKPLAAHTRRPLTIGFSVIVALCLASGTQRSAAVAPESGIVCTSGPAFQLTTRTGYIGTPDGNSIFAWGFSPGNGAFQLPGPVLCVTEGATVTVSLHNTLPEAVSLVFPGQENVLANGVPSLPVFSGPTMTSLAPVAAAAGGNMTYSFVATRPGTYLYESGTDPAKQVQMGLFGALVVRPAGHPERAYADPSTQFDQSAEYVMILSEIDPTLHQAVERNRSYDYTRYHPRYWMINGRSFPDTIAPNGASWLPTQPYGAMVHIRPYDPNPLDSHGDPNPNYNPDPALVRYLSVGTRNHPFHPHGNHGRVIGRDGSLLQGAAAADLSYEKFLVNVAPGQTWDVTYDWRYEATFGGQEWNPATHPIPELPQIQNLTFKDDATWYGGNPYLGSQDELPVGVTSFNECGEYYHMWHSHALNEAANFDAGFGGMMTLERIDPFLPNTCS
jgi:FtsP/CotA-like multicopper oxidase with cupredoxin domain